ncbi:MAG TPA: hypothetical protein EYP18_06125, partial [Desulfobacterales bacterium]|nr:hypothetical protein [Desulfobacterales bacterium]
MGIIAALLYGHLYLNRAYVEILVQSPENTYFSMRWASTGEQTYLKTKRARVQIHPSTEQYGFFLTDLRKIDSLRIDPIGTKGIVTVKSIIIRQPGFPTIQFSTAEDFGKLRPFGDVASAEFTDMGWVVSSTGSNPRFQFHLPKAERKLNWPIEAGRFLLMLVPALILLQLLRPLAADYSYATYCGFFVLALILTMAVVSQKNIHPDEAVHISATEYYETHWLPPAVESDEIRHTYSIYGFSRLNTMEPFYFFAGKLSALLKPFCLDHVLSLRMFNVLLFSILAFLTIQNIQYRLLFIPLLLSPQIWYIFSYVNSDAFSLFVAVLTGWQIVQEESALNRFLEKKKIPLLKIMGLGLLFALLLLVKKPFYFFILFLLFYFIWRCVFQAFADFKGMIKQLLILACIGSCLIGVRVAADISVNGFDKKEKMQAMQEITAASTYRPSTELHKKHIHLQMRERGTTLKTFIKQHHWGEKTFRSGVGVYGYMTVSGAIGYYDVMRIIGLASLLFICISIVLRGGWAGNTLLGGALLCSVTLIGIACYRAWTVDFQAQGRYLFAIVAILGMLLFKTEKVYNQRLLTTFACSMYLVSVCSFIGIALLGLAKYG